MYLSKANAIFPANLEVGIHLLHPVEEMIISKLRGMLHKIQGQQTEDISAMMETIPLLVNLTALERKFIRIWPTLVSSIRTANQGKMKVINI